jgi:hypothetical protein
MSSVSVLRLLAIRLIAAATLLAVPGLVWTGQRLPEFVTPQDHVRVERLKAFFGQRQSPAEKLAVHFVAAADQYDLDWRLLPSISMIESSGGKRYMNNNILGWDSCRVRFPTVRDGIYHVASRLAKSSLYRDKDLDAILRTYNPHFTYSRRVKSVMNALGPPDLGEPD